MRDAINPRTRRVSALLEADVPRPSLFVIVAQGLYIFFRASPVRASFNFGTLVKSIGRVYCTGGVSSGTRYVSLDFGSFLRSYSSL